MSTRTIATVSATTQSTVTCAHCGATFAVQVSASGSAEISNDVYRRDDMEGAAMPSLQRDARRTRSLVPCPSCKQRAPGAIAWACARVAPWFAAAPILPIIAPGPLEALWVIPVGLTVHGILRLWSERSRIRHADHAPTILLAPPSKAKEAELKARDAAPRPAALPRAVALSVPKPASAPPPAPPAPPTPIAVARPAPASGDEPSFLTSND